MKRKLSKHQLKVKRAAKEEAFRLECAAQELERKWASAPKFGDKFPTKNKPKPNKPLLPAYVRERMAEVKAIPSLVTTESQTGKPLPPRYEGEMAERERVAREVKHVVAPAANKMGYQLITDPEHLKTMGRKI